MLNSAAAEGRQDLSPEDASVFDSASRALRSSTSVSPRSTVYRKGACTFLSDALASTQGDSDAAQRIGRHQAEMRDEYSRRGIELRAGTTSGNYSGLTVPIYLVDEYAPLARAGRPFADAIASADLPPIGMTVNISRITTGSSTAVQATQNTAVSETDLGDTLLTIPVVSIGGAETVSFQALDRAALSEEVILADMVLSYQTTLDQQLISGTGAAGQHLGVLATAGINAVTYVDATPTVPKAYSKLADAIQRVNSLRFAPANLILMHPRRWAWFCAALDSSNRPLVVPQPGSQVFNSIGSGSVAGYGNGPVGNILGLPVIVDANVPTNLGGGTEDVLIICRAADIRLWESPGSPLYLRFERNWSPTRKQLQDVAIVYGYSAFTAGRYPASVSTVGGTSMVIPVW